MIKRHAEQWLTPQILATCDALLGTQAHTATQYCAVQMYRTMSLTGAWTALLNKASMLGRLKLHPRPCKSPRALVHLATPIPAHCTACKRTCNLERHQTNSTSLQYLGYDPKAVMQERPSRISDIAGNCVAYYIPSMHRKEETVTVALVPCTVL